MTDIDRILQDDQIMREENFAGYHTSGHGQKNRVARKLTRDQFALDIALAMFSPTSLESPRTAATDDDDAVPMTSSFHRCRHCNGKIPSKIPDPDPDYRRNL